MKKIIQWLTGGVIKEVGNVIDKLTTTEEEKLLIKKQIQEIMDKANSEAESQITRRWESDMKSDSWLSKNTRPMSLIFLTVSMVLLILLDSFDWEFNVSTGWVDLLQTLLVTVYVAYFGSRGAEKFQTIKNKK